MWKSEAEFLEDVRKLRTAHIVKTEAVINWAGRGRYFMYKWPDGGKLRDLYASNPRPILEAGFVCELFQQLTGLVEALRSLQDLEANRGSLYRQGSLRPEDIWICEDGSQVGVMKLCGMEWKGRHLQHDSTPNRPSYEPPEAGPDGRSTRSWWYDVWSVGCIILELMVWLLYGNSELESFTRSINVASKSGSPYWLMEEDGTQRRAQVHPKVRACMDHIARDPECNGARVTAIGDLLTMVRTQLLVVQLPPTTVLKRQGRASSEDLLNRLRGIVEKGRADSTYWYTGISRDGLPGPCQSTSSASSTAIKDV